MPSGHPPSPSPVIVGNCITCGGLLRVSSTTNANSDVRCPHCQLTFPLMKLLESAVPEVEVVQPQSAPAKKQELYIDKTSETAKDASGKFVVPSQLAKGARRRKSSRSRSGSRSSSSSGSGSSDSSSSRSHESQSTRPSRPAVRHDNPNQANTSDSFATAATTQTGSRAETARRPQETQEPSSNPNAHRSTRHRDSRVAEAQQAEGNVFIDFLKVIAGASLALPIAYLIVMWVFSRDPLSISERVGGTAPFLVPPVLRAEANAPEASTPSPIFDEDIDEQHPHAIDSGFENLTLGEEALQGIEIE